MSKVTIPQGYHAPLSVYELQRAIEFIKSNFQTNLSNALNLRRVSAPLFVEEASGLNDNLNGYERPVSFDIPDVGAEAQVVHSLAKWKRLALKRYQFNVGKGLFTDMNAIRRDEEVDNLHSVYVDQWDWEKVIAREDRTVDYLKRTVRDIVGAVCETNDALGVAFPSLHTKLERDVYFITTQELEDRYPDKTPKERENAIVREHHTVFLMQIGGKLKSGKPHDGRADVQLGDLGEVRELGAVDDLNLRKERAVGQVDEAEILACAQIAHPAADLDLLAGIGVSLFEKGTDRNELFHGDRSSL